MASVEISTALEIIVTLVSIACWLFYAQRWPRVGWENLYVQSFEIATWFIAAAFNTGSVSILNESPDPLTRLCENPSLINITAVTYPMNGERPLLAGRDFVLCEQPRGSCNPPVGSCVANGLMMDTLQSLVSENLAGQRVPWIRYASWMMTTPIILLQITSLPPYKDFTGMPRDATAITILCNQAMLILGVSAAMMNNETARLLFFGVACVPFAVLLKNVGKNCKSAADVYPPAAKTMLLVMTTIFIGAWMCFPVLWIFDEGYHQLEPEVVTLCYAVLDLFSKNSFGLLSYQLAWRTLPSELKKEIKAAQRRSKQAGSDEDSEEYDSDESGSDSGSDGSAYSAEIGKRRKQMKRRSKELMDELSDVWSGADENETDLEAVETPRASRPASEHGSSKRGSGGRNRHSNRV